ncbi:hypothetical protein C8F04DRAFT_1197903 [Mycena alexandri]|uniref:Uncharacterized protein n=1 Tax=Mycena alexandri TaxID=1745969 RepID=A0AAD6S3I2_9AGAR|nr:hypothetical protein C8F04DRAFT_1197903 [Mycena alexandri]
MRKQTYEHRIRTQGRITSQSPIARTHRLEKAEITNTCFTKMLGEGQKMLNLHKVEEAVVVECGVGRKSWRICVTNPTDGIADEVVFAVQGIITRSNLVPTNIQHMDHRRVMRLTQHLEITGFDTSVFEESMTRLELAQDLFAQHFGGHPITRLSVPVGKTGHVLGASNRIFTMKVDAPTEQGSEFQPGMDPLGSLERLKSEELIHGPENIENQSNLQASGGHPIGQLVHQGGHDGQNLAQEQADVDGGSETKGTIRDVRRRQKQQTDYMRRSCRSGRVTPERFVLDTYRW